MTSFSTMNSRPQSYRDLLVWQKGIELGFVTTEQASPSFGLIGDLRRMLNALRRRLDGDR